MAAQQRRKRPRDEAFETPLQTIRLFGNPTVTPGPLLTVDSISSRLWRALRGHGDDAYHLTQFLRGMPWENNKEEQEQWMAWRFLGAGGHGAAAVWIKKDQEGNLLDEIVLKEQRNPTRNFCFLGIPLVSSEAVLHNVVNVYHESENIVHLRDFKAHVVQEPTHEAWRFYLEHAPHGNLENLRLRYRAFHRYMPEKFLWHVFNSLAKAILTLDDVPGDGEHVIHADIKPDKVFLGYEELYDQSKPTGGLRTSEYPTIKLGDFGCAKTVNEDESPHGSFFKFVNRGTPGFYPPEQPTSERRDPWGYGHAFDPPVN